MIEVRNLSKAYTVNKGVLKVLENISFDVKKSEIVCILGSSGCGKSTLLRLLGGFDVPDSGEIAVEDQKVSGPSSNAILIFQDFNQLLPWKTVFGNILYPLKINKRLESELQRKECAMKYLELVGLKDFCSSYPHQLSGGMKQKASLARALAMHPSILLMDEPFGSLDAMTRQNLQALLLEIWQKSGVSIVFVTHDIQEAILLSDRIIIMSKNPGGIKAIINNSLHRPRGAGGIEYIQLYDKLQLLLGDS